MTQDQWTAVDHYLTDLEPIRISLRHEKRRGHRRNAEKRYSFPAFYPNE